uniref:Ig-like domain-containing protein n=1 Tax=Hucho hucho TaxID=62062 RepID=A0A4W5JNS7_9TELE
MKHNILMRFIIINPPLLALSPSGVYSQSLEAIPSSPEMKNPGEPLSLSCKGSGFTFSSYNMAWIHQPAGRALEWIGFIWSDASGTAYAKSVEGRIEVTIDNSNSKVYLELSGVRTEDSAVYYYARETQWYEWHNFLFYYFFGQPGAHSNTQTSFTKEVSMFSESTRSEAVGMTRDHSNCNQHFWVSGKTYEVKSTSFSLGM